MFVLSKILFIFASAIRKERKDILLNNLLIATEKKEQTYINWAAPVRAQISHICMWLVASREVCGESLRLLC